MLLSIIGDILGREDEENRATDGGSSDDMLGGELAGSMSEEELLPGASTGGGANTGGGGSDDDIFGDDGGDDFMDDGGDDFLDDGGDDDFLADDGDLGGGEMSIDEMDDADSGVSSEIEARVEEMENDVGSLSSTVNTVQSENEKINESLEDIEDNIRKLLEVYEMVTQGVNPFVEEDSLNDTFGGGGAPGTGNFGGGSLFDSDDDGTDDEEMDDDIASAEAEEFLDESIIEDDDFADEDFADDDFDDEAEEEPEADSSGGGEDLSFDELKSEFESGDAEWVEDEDGADSLEDEAALEEDETLDEADEFEEEDPFATADDDLEGDDELSDDLEGDDELSDDLGSGDELSDDLGSGDGLSDDLEAGDELTDGLADEPTDSLAADDHADESVGIPWDDGGRPYLESVPSEYDTEFVVMDWLDYLVAEAGLDGASETVRFYGSVHWVSESVEAYLQTILKGFRGGPSIEDPEPRSALGVDHKRSLWWISQIAAPGKSRPSYEEWLEQEGLVPESDEEPDAADADDGTDTDDAGTKLTYSESDAAEADEPETDGDTGVGVESVEHIEDRPADAPQADADDDSDGQSARSDEGGGHKIVIDESDDDPSTGDEPAEPPRAELEANGERMIWVDSDVVLSESGVELRNTSDGHRVQSALEHARPPVDADPEELEEWRESVVKPLIASDDETGLERWQIELIRSLLSPDHDADR